MTQVLEHDTDMDNLGIETDHERGAWMSTYLGGRFYPLDPKPNEIFIEDIAHALSMQNRFNGHTNWPYTVAQHSVHVSDYVGGSPEQRLYGLLHDAAEAYIGDLIRPIKYYLPQFKEIEDDIMCAVFDKFEIWPTKAEIAAVKTVDNLMCAAEMRDIRRSGIVTDMPDPSIIPLIQPWSHSYAKGMFTRRFNELVRAMEGTTS
jgi:hypothetical protein